MVGGADGDERWGTATTSRKNVAGRAVATLVMLGGIGFLSVITASITSGFVARSRQERLGGQDAAASAQALEEIVERLRRIEAALTERTWEQCRAWRRPRVPRGSSETAPGDQAISRSSVGGGHRC